MHGYKKAILDLEVPVQWQNDKELVERNNLRVSMHLNCAACALKIEPGRAYPHLQTPKMHYDVHHDGIFHCERVLAFDPHNVKALYRRAMLHLMIPPERHINGLALAFDDLEHALDADPNNADVKRELKRAKAIQKKTDDKAAGMFTKMIAAGVEV